MANKRVLIVGSAENSDGGVASAIRLIKKMPVWNRFSCYWLGTQIQASKWTKLWYALKAYMKALCIIWRYDIVHFHTVPNISIKIQLPIFLLALLGRKKIILHLHVGNQLEDKTAKEYKLFHWCMKHSNRIVLLANKFKETFQKHYPYITTPVNVIYNACESCQSIPYEEHDKTILFAGAFVQNKSGEHLIEAFAQLKDIYPEWKLVMLGDGPNMTLYKKMAKSLGVEHQLELPGYVKGDILKWYFQKAGIFCLCSHHEGFPMVVLEAWQYGVPVITTPVGGLPDIIEEGTNALTYQYSDISMLRFQLKKIMDNSNLCKELGKQGKLYAEQLFSLSKIDRDIERLYISMQ